METQNRFSSLPNQTVLSSLNQSESEVIAKVLQMAVYADGVLSREETQTLQRELALLPGVGGHFLKEADPMGSFFERTGSHVNLPHPDKLEEQLRELCEPLDQDAKKLATLRLVAVLFASDGVASEEVGFYKTLVKALDYDEIVADQVFRAAWGNSNQTQA